VAIVVAARKAGLDPKALKKEIPRLGSIPFESQHKFMATVHHLRPGAEDRTMLVKGAADRLVDICKDQYVDDDTARRAPIDRDFWHERVSALSSRGLRVLALCEATLDESVDVEDLEPEFVADQAPFLTMVGLVAILDPPRKECMPSIRQAHEAGVVVKMITGDHADTALAIGNMLGIAEKDGLVYTGPELDAMSEEELQAVVKDCNIFARASPENKIQIVHALQAVGEITSMTGDGVNDAPALKAANIGVAMGIAGTDVSKEASQMVLADDNFCTILAAVQEGRRVWENLRKILVFNLPCNFAQGLSVFFSLMFRAIGDVPLTVTQVLYINMITAVTMGLMLACEPAEPNIMQKPPRRPKKRLFGKLVVWRICFVSSFMIIAVLSVFAYDQQSYSLEERRGEVFTLLICMEVAYSLNCRFLKKTAICKDILFGNKWAYLSIGVVFFLQVIILYSPILSSFVFGLEGMDLFQWARVIIISLFLFFFVEFEKAIVDPVLFPLVKPILRPLGLMSEKSSRMATRNMRGGRRRRNSDAKQSVPASSDGSRAALIQHDVQGGVAFRDAEILVPLDEISLQEGAEDH